MDKLSAGRPVRLISGRTSGDDSIYKELIVHPIQARNDLACALFAQMRACKIGISEPERWFAWVISIDLSVEMICANQPLGRYLASAAAAYMRKFYQLVVAYARGKNHIMRARCHVMPSSL